jgi:hypothetical protein
LDIHLVARVISWVAAAVGFLVVPLFALYVVLYLIFRTIGSRRIARISPHVMPVLQAVPISTKEERNLLRRLVTVIFVVREWQLAESWTFTLPDTPGGEAITLVLHKGFVFDGASVPKIFWAFLSPTGLLLIPGLIHDYGYRYDQIWEIDNTGAVAEKWRGKGREHWDQLFVEVGNQVNGVFVLSCLSRLAVQFGGKAAWERNRKKNESPVAPE